MSRPNRIVVIGSSCAGKTTFARQLAERLGAPHIELDALHWNPNWQSTPADQFREKATVALAGDRWVVDGNYRNLRDIVWGRADTLIWLNYRFPLVLGRALRRTVVRVATGETVCNGNRETLRLALSRESIMLWVLTTYWRRRREFHRELRRPEFAHLRVMVFYSPRDAGRWLREIAPNADKSVKITLPNVFVG